MPREPTTKQLVEHIHEMMHENKQAQEFNTHLLRRILRKVGKFMTAFDDLTREVEETNAAVAAMLAKMQVLIDQIAANPGNEAIVAAAVAKLDELQTQMAAATNPDEPPVEPTP